MAIPSAADTQLACEHIMKWIDEWERADPSLDAGKALIDRVAIAISAAREEGRHAGIKQMYSEWKAACAMNGACNTERQQNG